VQEKHQKPIDLRRLFLGLQKQMIATLTTHRENILHPGSKGDASEFRWVKIFKRYLPKRYQVAKAFAVDSNGTISKQIDILIFDRQYSPFLLNQDDSLYVPAESVYATIEVKQEINKNYLESAGEGAASVRSLFRTSDQIVQAGETIENPKKPFDILSGIVSLDCPWNPPFGDPFNDTIKSLKAEKRIDFGCSLKHGAFNITYTEKTSVSPSIDVQKDDALIYFFLNLVKRLQKLGTVPAIDINAYLKALKP
jgi:hypothetical protein